MGENEKVELVEHSRYIVLDLLRETGILMEEEKQKNGEDSYRYNRLKKKYESLQYTQDLLVNNIRELLS